VHRTLEYGTMSQCCVQLALKAHASHIRQYGPMTNAKASQYSEMQRNRVRFHTLTHTHYGTKFGTDYDESKWKLVI